MNLYGSEGNLSAWYQRHEWRKVRVMQGATREGKPRYKVLQENGVEILTTNSVRWMNEFITCAGLDVIEYRKEGA